MSAKVGLGGVRWWVVVETGGWGQGVLLEISMGGDGGGGADRVGSGLVLRIGT